jgi:hypothetical protein
MSGGSGKLTQPMAQLLQSAVCKTNAKFRPSPSLFYFPGLTSAPVWSSSHIDLQRTNIPTYNLQKLKPIEDVFNQNHGAILGEYRALRESLKGSSNSDFDTSKVSDPDRILPILFK